MLQHILITFLKPFIYTLPAWIGYRLYRCKKKKETGEHISIKREVLLFAFYLYLLLVGTLTLLPQMDLSSAIPTSSSVNVVPFVKNYQKLQEALTCPVPMCLYNWAANILINIVLFFPLGMLLPAVSSNLRSLKSIALVAFCTSAAIEVFQYFLTYWSVYRFTDIDDVILNVAGAVAGFLTYKILLKHSLVQ